MKPAVDEFKAWFENMMKACFWRFNSASFRGLLLCLWAKLHSVAPVRYIVGENLWLDVELHSISVRLASVR